MLFAREQNSDEYGFTKTYSFLGEAELGGQANERGMAVKGAYAGLYFEGESEVGGGVTTRCYLT